MVRRGNPSVEPFLFFSLFLEPLFSDSQPCRLCAVGAVHWALCCGGRGRCAVGAMLWALFCGRCAVGAVLNQCSISFGSHIFENRFADSKSWLEAS